MRNYAAERRSTRATPALPVSQAPATSQSLPSSPPAVEPVDLADWVGSRKDRLSERWCQEVRRRGEGMHAEINGLLDEFLELLVDFLPAVLGPYRDQVEPLWRQAAELFGATAARRGLAAGEVIEEFQILREAVIRLLYQDPPVAGGTRLSLRDVLRLNRAIDRGVTHASIGHTDALFFSLFEGSGIPDSPPPAELVREVRAQLDSLRAELAQILGHAEGGMARASERT